MTRWNPAAAALLSPSLELAVGMPLQRWVLPADRDALADLGRRSAEAGSPAEGVVRFGTPGGDARPRSVRLTRDGEGWLLAATPMGPEGGEADDLRLQFLLSLPRHFFLEVSRDGTVRTAHGLARTHLVEDEGAVGAPYESLLRGRPEDRESARSMLEAAREGRGWRGLQWHERGDGVPFLARVYATPRRAAGSPEADGLLVSGLDVDGSRRQADRADEAERAGALGRQAGRAALRLVAELEALEAEGLLPDILARRLAPARGMVRAFQGLEEAASSQPRPVSVSELFQADGEPGVRRLRWSDGDLPRSLPDVRGAPASLRRVVALLLDGADRALGGEGPLEASARPSDGAVTFSFTRPGRQVGADRLSALFDVTAAAPSLASARALAVSQGGRVWAANAGPGEATLFSLSLPRSLDAADGDGSEAPGPDEAGARGATRVLVVDDDEAIRGIIGRCLLRAGYEVAEAWSGRSAMARITGGERPDVLVTDLRMLDGSGLWLLEQLEQYFPDLLRSTAIVTGDVSRGRALAERTGCPLVIKPFEVTALLAQIDRLA